MDSSNDIVPLEDKLREQLESADRRYDCQRAVRPFGAP